MRLNLTIINLDVSVDDSLIATTISKRKLIQEKLEDTGIQIKDIPAKDFLNILMQPDLPKEDKLISLSVKEISLQLAAPFYQDRLKNKPSLTKPQNQSPHELSNNKDPFWRFIQDVGDHQLNINSTFIQTISGLSFQLYIFGTEVALKNIPAKPLRMKFFSLEGTYSKVTFKEEKCDTNLLPLLGKDRHYYSIDLFVDDIKLTAGLNLINNYKSVANYFKKMSSSSPIIHENVPFEKVKIVKQKLGIPPVHTEPNRQTEQPKQNISWWDKVRLLYFGKIQLKFKTLAIDILTHTSPLSEECLRLGMELAYFRYTRKHPMQLLMQDISLSRLVESVASKNSAIDVILEIPPGQTSILKVPSIEALLDIHWNPKDTANDNYFFIKALQKENRDPLTFFRAQKPTVSVSINIPNKEKAQDAPLRFEKINLQKVVDSSPVPVVHYQAKLFSSLISLPQLSHEFLVSHGIKPVSLKDLDKKAPPGSKVNKPGQNGNLLTGAVMPTPGLRAASMNTVFETEGKSPDEINFRRKAIEGLSDMLTNMGAAEEFSSYIELVAFSLNEQINKNAAQNIIKFINEIRFKFNASTLRILMTNVEEASRVQLQTRNNSGDKYQLLGIQGVLTSIRYESIFYKKPVVFP